MGQNIVKSVKSLVSEANKVVNIMTVDEVKKILKKDASSHFCMISSQMLTKENLPPPLLAIPTVFAKDK